MIAPLITFAILSLICGITAPIINRGRKKAACFLSLLAGAAPIAFLLSFDAVNPRNAFFIFYGMFGALPLFLTSFFAFGIGEKVPADKSAAHTTLPGIFFSIIYTLILFHFLSRME